MREKITAIAKALDDKKGTDIQILHVEEQTTLTEYFVIATANSTTQVKALADNVEYQLKMNLDIMPHHVEGKSSSGWILLDYGFALVHVFTKEARDFYTLEKLWQDSNKIDISEIL